VHIGSWWQPTRTNRIADVNPSFYGGSEFLATLETTTILPALRLALGTPQTNLDSRGVHYQAAQFQWRELRRVQSLRGPKFVFVHFLLPHSPFVFDEGGAYITEQQSRTMTLAEQYVGQLRYTNNQLRRFLTGLLQGPRDSWPVVVLQADEGPYPDAYARDPTHFQWATATESELRQKFGILNAYLLPGVRPEEITSSIVPVNSFRAVFNLYFGAQMPLLPHKVFAFRNGKDHRFDLVDLTSRLRAESQE
jgi:phosphoglycerol transferase MdoB-like AlkP superfamily enzyme